uniref:Ionotropic receptor n=1 Tax=Semiothisa cinerearia TaxID=2249628 RepID=A0A889XLG1_9NEOP|nr:ionotropic receptor [Semiothisa cinerearia]
MLMGAAACLHQDNIWLAKDYFSYKNIPYVCYFSCEKQYYNKEVAKEMFLINTRTSVTQIDKSTEFSIEQVLYQWKFSVGVLIDGTCDNASYVLEKASKATLFDATHAWLILAPDGYNTTLYIEETFHILNLSIDADIAVVGANETDKTITDVFNFGKIQANGLEIASLGSWRPGDGLNIYLKGFKYYHRWNFHNLTLRAVSVMLHRPEVFRPELLASIGYTPGVLAITKIASQLLNLIKEQHNFRFNYTIADRWVGSPKPNSTLAVTNSLFWREQDIASTSTRVFAPWLEWVDVCFPPTATIQTKFYYLMLERGAGALENRFLRPLSAGAWWCVACACAACALVLAAAASLEARPRPRAYAFFSVAAVLFQQDFDDGCQVKNISSQGRKLTLLVVGVTSMLLYNYYTSSVVSWLLSAAPPSLTSLDQLIQSDLELVFEDIGYTRGWLQNPGFYYYSGYVNPKEDRMREVKVTKAKRTVEPLQSVGTGIELIRTGLYAYHTEPYTASREVSPRLGDEEVCALAALPLMLPAHVYIMVQKHSPYREFFIWR